ncbi:MAG: GSCFA domain-containing protein [Crocinitomicaceae bacterium]|nr:GSCFA domain-containing protein [Crocinitomicaceae bacterium]MDG1777354.1 GSCFA domain-containing protein [Crocinitomicaceae bacterium]
MDKTVLIGSCFSTEIAAKLSGSGFSVVSNPFGTLFHPEAIFNVIHAAITDDIDVEVKRSDDVFHSWDSSGGVFKMSESELVNEIVKRRKELKQSLLSAKTMIITFGSAWGYIHNDSSMLVGNCHKEHQGKFTKSLSSIVEMEKMWSSLIQLLTELNPELQLIFTVSPVRHKKDGLIENNRSKARLIELVHRMVESTSAKYFPAYEVLVDELRDYRFYSEDLVHPSSAAVDFIWDKFEQAHCSGETISLSQEVKKIKASESHKALYLNSNADVKMKAQVLESKRELLKKHPYLNF